MRKIGLLTLSLFLSAYLNANDTTTSTSFTNIGYDGIPVTGEQNEYGDLILHTEAEIRTDNFEVKNFWEKSHATGQDESTYSNVSKIGTFKLTVSSTFACAKAGLDAEGCSGQKPFLLNDGVLTNPDMREAGDGTALPAGEFRIPFDDAKNYLTTNDDAFYALDVDRNEEYYKEPETPPPAGRKSFFSFIVDFFRDYYSSDQRVFGDPLTPDEAALRDRYIANIVYGHDQEHRLTKEYDTQAASAVDTSVPAANNPVSLIDYEELLVTEDSGCRTWFFTLDPDSLRCRMITGFGMANWIPFFSDSTPTFETQSKAVMSDTEATLLALASELNDENYIVPAIDDTNSRGFLSELFKPMTNMMGGMFRFFFGTRPPRTVEAVAIEFEFDHPLPLTFAVTDGNIVTDFKHFDLLGVESVYGTEVESCRVRDVRGLFGWASTEQTFNAGDATDTTFDGGQTHHSISDDREISAYDQLTRTSEEYTELYWILPPLTSTETSYTIHVSTEDWLNWCKRNQGERGLGMFGRFFASLGRLLSPASSYDDQLDNLLAAENYQVVEYKEKVHRGLILHLQEQELELGATGTTTSYQMLNVRQGN